MIVEQRNNVGSAHTTPSRRDKPPAVPCERSPTYYRRHGASDSDNHLNGRCNGRNCNTLGGELLLFGSISNVRQT